MIFYLLPVLTCIVCAVPTILTNGIQPVNRSSDIIDLKDTTEHDIPGGYDIQDDTKKKTELETGNHTIDKMHKSHDTMIQIELGHDTMNYNKSFVEHLGTGPKFTGPEPELCPREQGFCLGPGPNYKDQNSGVVRLYNTNKADSYENWLSCLSECTQYPGATGCEVLYGMLRSNGCVVHTQPISKGSGHKNHGCWIFSKCSTASPTPPPTASPTPPPTASPTPPPTWSPTTLSPTIFSPTTYVEWQRRRSNECSFYDK